MPILFLIEPLHLQATAVMLDVVSSMNPVTLSSANQIQQAVSQLTQNPQQLTSDSLVS